MSTEPPALSGSDLELLQQAHAGYERLKQEIAKVIIGQQDIVRPALAAVFSQGHTLVIGVPGLAKTLLVKTLSQALDWSFKRIQFTPDMMPADIIGMELLQDDAATGTRMMKFVPGPLFAHIILADEINRTPPKTQSALLEAMSRDAVAAGGVPVRELRVDGGACVNDLLMQFQADLLGIPVVRPEVIETTALGAAYLAGLHAGVYSGTEELAAQWRAERTFEPRMPRDQAQEKMAQWERAVRQTTRQ